VSFLAGNPRHVIVDLNDEILGPPPSSTDHTAKLLPGVRAERLWLRKVVIHVFRQRLTRVHIDVESTHRRRAPLVLRSLDYRANNVAIGATEFWCSRHIWGRVPLD